MNKVKIGVALFCAASVLQASADVLVKVAPDVKGKKVAVSHSLISNLLTARTAEEMRIKSDTLLPDNNEFRITLDPEGPARYAISFDDANVADLYAAPGENLLVQVTALDPMSYTVSGTPLMEGMTVLEETTRPLQDKIMKAYTQGGATTEQLQAMISEYESAMKQYITSNPGNPAAVFALLNLEGADFLTSFANLGEGARKSILYPFAEAKIKEANARMEEERRIEALSSGTVDAPAFTLKDIAGKDVSLSDFRGKWIVLDFWGSWCGWCIKGFPALKDAYKEYGDKIVVIGIDNGDTDQAWRDAVKRYELPWINLYNPKETGQPLLESYGVSGFPTKVIINPQGKIADITVGEDPAFFTKLATLVK